MIHLFAMTSYLRDQPKTESLLPTQDVDQWIERLYNCDFLPEKCVKKLCERATSILSEQPNVVEVECPVTICGDVHGQFQDLLELFNASGGRVPHTHFLFLGDYVDRGKNSVETLSLLLALKVRYPDHLTLLRGNHECRMSTKVYGFYDECLLKYGNGQAWKYFTDVFDHLPLAAMVGQEVFCVHGGLSPDVATVDDVRRLHRVKELPARGAMCDLLWSDPESERLGWRPNSRGAGVCFGEDVSERFNQRNGLSLVCRAHQVTMRGYHWTHAGQVLTVFSAPNYCYRIGNKAAILELAATDRMNLVQFEHVPSKRQRDVTKTISGYFL